LRNRCAIKTFRQPRQRRAADAVGQRVAGEKPRLGDFAVGQARRALAKAAQDIDRDMVAARDRLVEEYAVAGAALPPSR